MTGSDAVTGPRHQDRHVARSRSSRLKIARSNTAYFVAFLYLQDVFWLAASRIQIYFFGVQYDVAPFRWTKVGEFVLLAVLFSAIAVLSLYALPPLKRIKVRQGMLDGVISVSVVLNITIAFYIAGNARYVSGSLTGIAGVIYAVTMAVAMAAMVIMVRQRMAGRMQTPTFLIVCFIVSYAVRLDGLASALTLTMFILLVMKPITIRRPKRVVAVALVIVAALVAGLNTKFITFPDYLTPDFLLRWTIARFAIQAEQMYTYLSGLSVIGNEIGYFELIWRMNTDRFNIILGNSIGFQYPRSVSEALYYDMVKTYGSGSSPGLLAGGYLMGFSGFLSPIIISFIFLQFFYGSVGKISLLRVIACSFLLKQIYTNISEYQVLISPSLLILFVFIWSSLLIFKSSPRTFERNAPAASGG